MKDPLTLWSVLLLMVVTLAGWMAALVGLSFEFECAPLADGPTCFFISVLGMLILVAGARVLFFLGIAWWGNRAGPRWERWVWLGLAIMLFPYVLFLYYWLVYRRLDVEGNFSLFERWKARRAA